MAGGREEEEPRPQQGERGPEGKGPVEPLGPPGRQLFPQKNQQHLSPVQKGDGQQVKGPQQQVDQRQGGQVQGKAALQQPEGPQADGQVDRRPAR